MPKKKVVIYHDAMREVLRAMDAVSAYHKSSSSNPWDMWLDVKVMQEQDLEVGRITLNESDDLVFIPNPEYFGEE